MKTVNQAPNGQRKPRARRGFNTQDWRSVIIAIIPVCPFLVIWCVIIMRLIRTADRTPVLVVGEGIAPTAGIAYSGIWFGHNKKTSR